MKSHPSDCSCVADIAKTAMQLQRAHPERVIYQTSLMSALLSGVYEGETTMADLLQHGDFGLGTFNHLDGEMIAFNRNIFQLRGDGSARRAKPEQKTPFAVMTFSNRPKNTGSTVCIAAMRSIRLSTKCLPAKTPSARCALTGFSVT